MPDSFSGRLITDGVVINTALEATLTGEATVFNSSGDHKIWQKNSSIRDNGIKHPQSSTLGIPTMPC